MNKEEHISDLGMVKIHKNVVASIAAIACMEIPGVKRVGGNFKGDLLEFIGRRPASAIKVEFDKKNSDEVQLDVPLVIKYGFNISEVASKVQENVRLTLEKTTHLLVKDINISVRGAEKD